MHLPFCNADNSSTLKGVTMLRKNALQRTIDSVGMYIAQAKRNHTEQRGSAGGDQFSKAKIMGQ